MEDLSNPQPNSTDRNKQDFLFLRLIFGFHTAAMQQMGKLVDPADGSVKRDLELASQSIDTLDMLQTKCKGNLSPEQEIFLKQMIAELKLNYVDEIGRPTPPNPTPNQDPSPDTDSRQT
jgi:hypothetical protein